MQLQRISAITLRVSDMARSVPRKTGGRPEAAAALRTAKVGRRYFFFLATFFFAAGFFAAVFFTVFFFAAICSLLGTSIRCRLDMLRMDKLEGG